MQVRQVLIPRLAAALSAVGGQFSDLTGHFTTGFFTTTNRFDRDGVNGVLERISTEMDAFFERLGGAGDRSREFVCEARYAIRYGSGDLWRRAISTTTPISTI